MERNRVIHTARLSLVEGASQRLGEANGREHLDSFRDPEGKAEKALTDIPSNMSTDKETGETRGQGEATTQSDRHFLI